MLRSNVLPLALVVLLQFIGFYVMYTVPFLNGYVDKLMHLRDHGPYVLPGSQNPILLDAWGIRGFDMLYATGAVFTANIFDGSSPSSSLYTFWLSGQLLPFITLLILEDSRQGNRKNKLIFWPVWFNIMQGLGVGIFMPSYIMVHLQASKTAIPITSDPDLPRKVVTKDRALHYLPVSLIIGYIIPVILTAWPFCSSRLHQQFIISFWALFIPLPVLQSIFGYFGRFSNQSSAKTFSRDDESRILNRIYVFVCRYAALVHWITFGLIGVAYLFPNLFPSRVSSDFTLRRVFIPSTSPYPIKPMTSMADVPHNFLIYDLYIGTTALILWTVTLYIRSQKTSITIDKYWQILKRMAYWSVMAGPCGACALLMQQRDEHLLRLI